MIIPHEVRWHALKMLKFIVNLECSLAWRGARLWHGRVICLSSLLGIASHQTARLPVTSCGAGARLEQL
jgi:hypothetical protein